jgi:hypothetical protein
MDEQSQFLNDVKQKNDAILFAKDELLNSYEFQALMTAYRQSPPNCRDGAFRCAVDFAIDFVAKELEKEGAI